MAKINLTPRASLVTNTLTQILLFAGLAVGEARPLPLASNYNTGQTGEGFTPEWQIEKIRNGHHLLVTFGMSGPDAKATDHLRKYFTEALQFAAAKKLPISFACPDFEAILYGDKKYRDLAVEESPLVIGTDGKILDFQVSYPPGKNAGVSPFGPPKWWRDAGQRYTDNELFHELQKVYPDPPYVLFISNNEARKLRWDMVEQSKRYLDLHGAGRPDAYKKKVTGDGYIQCYQALVAGVRSGLGSWKDRAIIGAYGGAPFKQMGRTTNWDERALLVPDRPAIEPVIWEAISPSQYLTTWDDNTDYTVFSPQTAAMNLVVQEKAFRSVRPDLFWEVSVWDANFRPGAPEKPKLWRSQGQSVPPERYGGLVKWIMWMPRAAVVRDFRWWHEPREAKDQFPGAWNSYEHVVAAVDEVHEIPVLARFWREGALVPHTTHKHPYNQNIPEIFKNEPRWFQLDCDANQPWPWGIDTEVAVWCFAYVISNRPNREWLVYAFAPKGDRMNVTVSIPDFTSVELTATQGGAYYHVIEANGNSANRLRASK